MNDKSFLNQSSFLGYVHCKLILDKDGKGVGMDVLEANDAFEIITGIKKSNFVGQTFNKSDSHTPFSVKEWVDIYGDTALSGSHWELEKFYESSQKWGKVHVSSPEKMYFTVAVVDITDIIAH